jgi:hypothetical protein
MSSAMASAILLPVPAPVLALVRAPVLAAFAVSIPPAVLMLGFIFYFLFSFRGPSPKFRFSSGVITGFSGAVLLPYSLFPHSLVATLLRFRGMLGFQFLHFRLLGLFGFGLRKRARAEQEKTRKNR